MSRRTQVLNAICNAVAGTRGLRYQGETTLPGRSVFDLNEAALPEFGKIVAQIEVTIESILDSRDAPEGDTLDTELAAIQKAVLNDLALADVIDRVTYTGSNYSFSENGSTLVAVAATFNVTYRASVFDPNVE